MKRRDFFKRLGTVSAAVAIPTLTIAAVAVKSSEPEVPKVIKFNQGHYTHLFTKEGQMYKMSYNCKIFPEIVEVDNVSVHRIQEHIEKGMGQVRASPGGGGFSLGFNGV